MVALAERLSDDAAPPQAVVDRSVRPPARQFDVSRHRPSPSDSSRRWRRPCHGESRLTRSTRALVGDAHVIVIPLPARDVQDPHVGRGARRRRGRQAGDRGRRDLGRGDRRTVRGRHDVHRRRRRHPRSGRPQRGRRPRRYTERARRARAQLVAVFRPQRLVRFLRIARRRTAPPPDRMRSRDSAASLLDSLSRRTGSLRWRYDDTRHRRARRARTTWAARKDDALDKVGVCARSVAWIQSELRASEAGRRPRKWAPRTSGGCRRARRRRRSGPLPTTLEERVRPPAGPPGRARTGRRARRAGGGLGARSWSTSAHTGARRSGASTRPDGRIYAFEPDPRHAAFLDRRASGDSRRVVDRRAVTNRSGDRVQFYVSEESSGISGLSAFRRSHVGSVRSRPSPSATLRRFDGSTCSRSTQRVTRGSCSKASRWTG